MLESEKKKMSSEVESAGKLSGCILAARHRKRLETEPDLLDTLATRSLVDEFSTA